MKRIPKQFKLIGQTIKVRIIPKSLWRYEDCVAIFEPDHNRISVMRQSSEMTRHAFWHETMHAVLNAINHPLYSDEVFVDNTAALLTQIMESAK